MTMEPLNDALSVPAKRPRHARMKQIDVDGDTDGENTAGEDAEQKALGEQFGIVRHHHAGEQRGCRSRG